MNTASSRLALALLLLCMLPLASARDDPQFQDDSIVKWLYAKAISVTCKREIADLDGQMERSLAYGAAAQEGVTLSKANYAEMLRSPEALIAQTLPTTVTLLGRNAALNCDVGLAWAEGYVKTSHARSWPPVD